MVANYEVKTIVYRKIEAVTPAQRVKGKEYNNGEGYYDNAASKSG